jgi:hypothetical protein
MKERTHHKVFLPAVVVMLLLIALIISFGGKGSAEQAAEAAQANQCQTLCNAIADCAPGPLQAFTLADCAGYGCSKQSDCTNVTCGGNPPEELKQALGC